MSKTPAVDYALKIIEFLADGALGESDAALMPGSRPGIFMILFVVFPDRLHERRQEIVAVTADCAFDPSRDKLRKIGFI